VASRISVAKPIQQMKLSEADFKEQFDIAIKDLLAYNNIQSAANKYVLSSRANLLELTKT
jgi:hypothetical protein